jgi:hypothetical protein
MNTDRLKKNNELGSCFGPHVINLLLKDGLLNVSLNLN